MSLLSCEWVSINLNYFMSKILLHHYHHHNDQSPIASICAEDENGHLITWSLKRLDQKIGVWIPFLDHLMLGPGPVSNQDHNRIVCT